MPGLTSIGGRGRLVAVSCAAVSTAVVVSWHMRARRRASTSLRASLTVGGLNAPSRASDNDCDALEKLATEFQVPSLPGMRELLRLLTRRGPGGCKSCVTAGRALLGRATPAAVRPVQASYRGGVRLAGAVAAGLRCPRQVVRAASLSGALPSRTQALTRPPSEQAVVATGRCPDEAKRNGRLHIARR